MDQKCYDPFFKVETEKLRHELENNLDNFKGNSSVIEKMQSKHKEVEVR